MVHQPHYKGLEGIEQDALPWGIKKTFNHDLNRVEWQVRCECDRADNRAFSPRVTPAYMARKFKEYGWELREKHKPVCPSCAKQQRANKQMPKETIKIGPDLKVTRRIMAILNDVFNEETHRYTPGVDDAMVARDAECGVELVAHIREEAYGPIAEDPVLHEVRAELEALMAQHKATMAEISDRATSGFNSINDRFKNEMLQHEASIIQAVDAADDLFSEEFAKLNAKLGPAERIAS